MELMYVKRPMCVLPNCTLVSLNAHIAEPPQSVHPSGLFLLLAICANSSLLTVGISRTKVQRLGHSLRTGRRVAWQRAQMQLLLTAVKS